MSKARPCSPSTVRNQRHPYWHTWVFPGSNPGSRKDKNLKHNAVLRVRLRHPSPLGGSLGRRVGYGPVNQGNRREVGSARLENRGGPHQPGGWGKGGSLVYVPCCLLFVFLYCISLRRLLDAVPHITRLVGPLRASPGITIPHTLKKKPSSLHLCSVLSLPCTCMHATWGESM